MVYFGVNFRDRKKKYSEQFVKDFQLLIKHYTGITGLISLTEIDATSIFLLLIILFFVHILIDLLLITFIIDKNAHLTKLIFVIPFYFFNWTLI